MAGLDTFDNLSGLRDGPSASFGTIACSPKTSDGSCE